MHSSDFVFGMSMQLDPTAFVADPELVEALTRRATPVDCKEDRVLFRQGDEPAGLFILQTGKAAVSMLSNAGETIASFETPKGSLLGLPGVISGQPYTLGAVARAGAQVCFISKDQFNSFMQTFPLYAFKILQVLAAEVSAARRAMVP